MANIRGPWPQRGWSCVGAEQTAGLRKENLKDNSAEGMEDSKVSLSSEAIWFKKRLIFNYRNMLILVPLTI